MWNPLWGSFPVVHTNIKQGDHLNRCDAGVRWLGEVRSAAGVRRFRCRGAGVQEGRAPYGTITPHFIAAHKSVALLIMPRESQKKENMRNTP